MESQIAYNLAKIIGKTSVELRYKQKETDVKFIKTLIKQYKK